MKLCERQIKFYGMKKKGLQISSVLASDRYCGGSSGGGKPQ